MPTLYLIRGLPGSGKSTFARSLYKNNMVHRVLEADQYFTDAQTGGYNFNPHKLHEAHALCQDHAKMLLRDGYSIAISNTSATEKEVEVYKEIASSFDAQFVSIIVEKRHVGKNIHNVPDQSIARMRHRFSVKL